MTMRPTDVELEQMRATVRTLSELIGQLYPDTSPDILTADDAAYRYQLSGLGERAMQALAQSQRIVRASGNYDQIGLCEFHAGLVFLYWGRCGSARERFAEARHQWQFSSNTATKGLTYFAEGRAQHHAHQYEWAMGKYSRVEQCLPRVHFAVVDNSGNDFAETLTSQLKIAQEDLREAMWPDGGLEMAEPMHDPTSADSTADPAQSTPPAPISQPHFHVGDYDPPTQPEAQQSEVPRPIVNPLEVTEDLDIPVRGHRKTAVHYAWYFVDKKDDEFLPDIPAKTWLLVDRDLSQHEYQRDELIVVLQPDIDQGGIVLRPHRPEQPFQRIYLARSQFAGRFSRPSTAGAVELSSQPHQRMVRIYPENIMGVVIGWWHSVLGGAE